MTVTVLTPSLPERAGMRERAIASVRSQTYEPVDHRVVVNVQRVGITTMRNRLVADAETEWVAFLDDDDEWTPTHLEQLIGHAQDADVVVADTDWIGVVSPDDAMRDWETRADAFVAGLPVPPIRSIAHSCDYSQLRERCWFTASAALLRRDMVLDVGGFPEACPPVWEDWGLWRKLYAAGARFACSHEMTCRYHAHEGQTSA